MSGNDVGFQGCPRSILESTRIICARLAGDPVPKEA